MKDYETTLNKDATLNDFISFVYNGYVNGCKSYDVIKVFNDFDILQVSYPLSGDVTFDQLRRNYDAIYLGLGDCVKNIVIKLRRNYIF